MKGEDIVTRPLPHEQQQQSEEVQQKKDSKVPDSFFLPEALKKVLSTLQQNQEIDRQQQTPLTPPEPLAGN